MKEEIKKHIKEVLSEMNADSFDFTVDFPTEFKKGDYFSNVALVLAKRIGKNPLELAGEIALKLEGKIKDIEKIEAASPGFVNFYLSKEFFENNLGKMLGNLENFGKSNIFDGKNITVEYTDPNILKPFHIGHLMSNTIGESISRLVEFSGAKVRRVTYGGDVGLHVAKALWGISQIKDEMPSEQDSLRDKMNFLGRAYVLGASAYEESEEGKEDIANLNVLISKGEIDSETRNFYDLGRKWSLEHFEEIYEILGSKFDKYYFESETAPIGLKIVRDNQGKIFEESDGALVYKGEKKGLHTRVFVNSKGVPTYEAKELALPKIKYADYPYDISIVITANEQDAYFKVVLGAILEIEPELGEKTKHISHGMFRFGTEKMSSRKGNVVTGEELLTNTIELAKSVIENRNFNDSKKKEVARQVAVAALKYVVLKQSIGKDIVYEKDKALSFDGDSGPYLQYALTRAKSVIRKTGNKNLHDFKNLSAIYDLERLFLRFEETVERASLEYAPHMISSYLINLASAFNSFYTKEKIIDENGEISNYRLAMTLIFANIMEKGLYLLGIQSPDKM